MRLRNFSSVTSILLFGFGAGLSLAGCDVVGPPDNGKKNANNPEPWIVCAPTGMSPQACSVVNTSKGGSCNLATKSRHSSEAAACSAARGYDECNTQPNIWGC